VTSSRPLTRSPCRWGGGAGNKYEDSYFAVELEVIAKAAQLIDKFNAAGVIDRVVYLNHPEIWTFTQTGGSFSGAKVLVEPMITNFEKFNSNTGWTPDNGVPWNLVMQALSHFSYHVSSGMFVLCDLQGGVYSNGVVLTDPVVMTAARKFGPTDLGIDGITTFFARHQCNRFCNPAWQRPRRQQALYPERQGTLLEAMHVPTRGSRQSVSQQRHGYN